MTEQKFREIFAEDSGNWAGDNGFQGLQIIAQYFDVKKEDILVAAEHDIIYSVGVEKMVKAGISEVDAKTLRRINWMIDIDSDCLACFV